MTFLYGVFGIRKAILILQNLIINLTHRKRFGNSINVLGWPILKFTKGSQVSIGKNLRLISAPYFSPPGVNHPVILSTTNADAILNIGDDVGISGGGIVAAKEVIIGNNVLMGANVFITDTDFHPLASSNRRYSHEKIKISPVRIGNNVFIGMDSIILKGVSIGDNSIVGAGSVVTHNIPENSIAAGNPAKIISSIPGMRIT